MDKKLLQAEEWRKQNTPEVYNRKPDIEWIEAFIWNTYFNRERIKLGLLPSIEPRFPL